MIWHWDGAEEGDPVVIEVTQGARIRTVAAQLDQYDLIASPVVFEVTARLLGNGGVRAGEFELSPTMSMAEMWQALSIGQVYLRRITIPEGLTVRQVIALLENNPYLVGEVVTLPIEGSLLPDGYAFARGTSRQAMIDLMQANMTVLKQDMKASGDMVILASIIEKETGLAEERGKIAGVFHNRLRLGMKLQSDPTVVYAVSGGLGKLGRPLTRRDLTNPSPYNTYEHFGLPPTPIANPGKAAILAALNPEQTDALYFVADGKGGHVFAETLEQHNRNVAQWRRIERERRGQGATGPVPSGPIPSVQ